MLRCQAEKGKLALRLFAAARRQGARIRLRRRRREVAGAREGKGLDGRQHEGRLGQVFEGRQQASEVATTVQ
jgi:hypothetical protein